MKIGFLNCYSGVSGDMLLGALLDCGLSLDQLTAELAKLPLQGYHLTAQPVKKGIITATQATVIIEGGATVRRTLTHILDLIERSSLPAQSKEKSGLVFTRLAEAEARVHGVPVEEVHFHEVGAVDAIVDVVGAVVGLSLLGIEALYSAPLATGGGLVQTDHGTIPVPAPATMELVAAARAPIRVSLSPDVGELTTPTGAAIATTLALFDSPVFHLERVGYGAGTRDIPAAPNVLPLWLGEMSEEQHPLLLLETNIDDMSAELHGYVMERLFKEGALDVWFTPIQMKKNRPAVMLSVLCPPEAEAALVETILRETSTLGVRASRMERREAERETVPFHSSLGTATVKVKRLHERRVGLAPEFDDCRLLAERHGLSLQEVYRIVTLEAGSQLLDP